MIETTEPVSEMAQETGETMPNGESKLPGARVQASEAMNDAVNAGQLDNSPAFGTSCDATQKDEATQVGTVPPSKSTEISVGSDSDAKDQRSPTVLKRQEDGRQAELAGHPLSQNTADTVIPYSASEQRHTHTDDQSAEERLALSELHALAVDHKRQGPTTPTSAPVEKRPLLDLDANYAKKASSTTKSARMRIHSQESNSKVNSGGAGPWPQLVEEDPHSDTDADAAKRSGLDETERSSREEPIALQLLKRFEDGDLLVFQDIRDHKLDNDLIVLLMHSCWDRDARIFSIPQLNVSAAYDMVSKHMGVYATSKAVSGGIDSILATCPKLQRSDGLRKQIAKELATFYSRLFVHARRQLADNETKAKAKLRELTTAEHIMFGPLKPG